MKSPVKPRLMRILIDGEPHREIELATGAGFTKIATIQKWIDLFQNAGFIERYRSPDDPEYFCRLVTSRESGLKIYNHPEFRTLRPEIRQAPWFCRVFLSQFASLPDDLPQLVGEMARASHTFFETICIHDTPEKIRETYQSALLVNRLSGISDPAFDDLCIYYQIFVHSIIRDIRYGGLSGGFARLLARMQETVEERYAVRSRAGKRRGGPAGGSR